MSSLKIRSDFNQYDENNENNDYYYRMQLINRFKERVMSSNTELVNSDSNLLNSSRNKKIVTINENKKNNPPNIKLKRSYGILSPIDKLSISCKREYLDLKKENDKLEMILRREERKRLPPIKDEAYKKLIGRKDYTSINTEENKNEKQKSSELTRANSNERKRRFNGSNIKLLVSNESLLNNYSSLKVNSSFEIKQKELNINTNLTNNCNNFNPLEMRRKMVFSQKKSQKIMIVSKSKNKKQDFYQSYLVMSGNNPKLIDEIMEKRKSIWKKGDITTPMYSSFIWTETNQEIDFVNSSNYIQYLNHFEFNGEICNKMKLFANLLRTCDFSNKKSNLFTFFPFTIIFPLNEKFAEIYNKHIESFKYLYENIDSFLLSNLNQKSKNYNEYFYSVIFGKRIGETQRVQIPNTHFKGKNMWIIKPINMNRGRQIIVESNVDKIIEEIEKIKKQKEINLINKKQNNSSGAEYLILQKYVESPLLYKQRKFDIRIWVLLIGEQPNDVYIFKEGHLKASCENYSLESNDKFVHLTNYSVQKKHSNFSKVEKGNEISYKMFQEQLDQLEQKIDFRKTIYSKITKIIRITAGVAKFKINILNRRRCFEIFGYDFLIDSEYNPFLLEINTNPGYEISSPLISQLVPRMIDDALKLTIDESFPVSYNNNEEKVFHVDGYNDNENMWEKYSIIFF